MARGLCGCCGGEYNINADDTIRYHLTDRPECQATPGSRKCSGVGQPPAGAEPTTAGELRFLCRVPSGPEGCGHQVQLTANHRARSHLTPHGTKCAEGSSAPPIAVGDNGFREDTADWDEAKWEQMLGQPEPDARDATVQPRAVETVDLPHDRGPAGAAFISELKTAVGDPGTVADQLAVYRAAIPQLDPVTCACSLEWVNGAAMLRAGHDPESCEEAPMVAGPVEPEDVFDVVHQVQDESGIDWIHPGEAGDCSLPGCCTHPRGFTYVDDDNGLSGSFCPVCGEEEPGPVPEPEPEPTAEELARAIVGQLDEGVLFVRHTARPPLSTLVYRAQKVHPDAVEAIVVSPGQYGGRHGMLTTLTEEITCTDIDGRPRPRNRAQQPPSTTSTPRSESRPSSTRSTPGRTTAPGPAPSSRPSGPASANGAPVPTEASSTPGTASASGTATSTTRTAPTRKRTSVADAFSTPKETKSDSDKYDRYGRYKLLHPDSGKKVNWTRATTFAKSIQDTFALSQWAQRMTLKGASLRPDIVAAVATLEVKADKDRVNSLVEDAKKAAGDKVAANLGTAVHAFTEDRDKALVGMPVKPKQIPDDLMPTVDAYESILASFGLEPVPGLIEFTTAVKQYEVAGTSDRCYRVTRNITFKLNGRTVTLYAGEYVIGDVKTGADLSYGWQEIAIQLALYAQGLNTCGVWDWNTGRWSRPVTVESSEVQLKVRTDVGIVPHLPVDRSETGAPLATLYAVDLDAGWAATVLCGQVRSWRKERTLATPLTVADVEETDPGTGAPVQAVAPATARAVPESRPASLEDKARAVTSRAEASQVWKEATAARVSKAELERLTGIMQKKLASFVEQGA